MRWTDNRLAFEPAKEGRFRKEFVGRAALQELEKMWQPEAMIRNLVGNPRSDEIGLIVDNIGRVTLVRTVEGAFRMPIDMSHFPFDRPQLNLDLTSGRYSDRELVFVSLARDEGLNFLTQKPRATGWTLARLGFTNDIATAWNGEARSQLTLNVTAIRQTTQILTRIFVPFLTIMLSGLFVLLSPDTNYFPKGTLIFSAMVALVALNFTLENSFPGSLSLPTPIATILTSGFFYLALALALNILVMNPEARWAKQRPYMAAEIRSLIRWAVPALMLLIWGAVVGRAIF